MKIAYIDGINDLFWLSSDLANGEMKAVINVDVIQMRKVILM